MQFRTLRTSCWAALICVAVVSSSFAENWPSWRGPSGNGISSETGLPAEFGPDKNVAWKFPLPKQAGDREVPAGSTPVVWGDRIFLSGVDGNELVLLCISTAGKQLWRAVVSEGNKISRSDEGNSASPSPSTDGKHVWVMMGDGAMACYTVDGKKVWRIDLQERYGKFRIAFGMTSTPIVHGGRVFLQLIHGDGKAATQEALVAALDALTGKEVWKHDRVTAAHSENEHSYASPILYDDGMLSYIVSHGADYSIAHALDTGKELWRLEGLNPHEGGKRQYHPTLRFVASPASAPGIIVVPTAKNGPVFAVKPNGSGSLPADGSHILWTYPKTPDVPSPLIKDGLVYLNMANGALHCLKQDTGDELYAERTHGHRHRASPILADGKIYLTARDGVVSVVQVGKEFKLLATNKLGEEISASPAVSDKTLYFRTYSALWAVRQK